MDLSRAIGRHGDLRREAIVGDAPVRSDRAAQTAMTTAGMPAMSTWHRTDDEALEADIVRSPIDAIDPEKRSCGPPAACGVARSLKWRVPFRRIVRLAAGPHLRL